MIVEGRLRHQLVSEDRAEHPRPRLAAVRSADASVGPRDGRPVHDPAERAGHEARPHRGAREAVIRAAAGLLALGFVAACAQPVPPAAPASPAALGKLAFADPSLSEPAGQACADCHAASYSFRDPEADHSTSMGVVAGRFGSRNSPSAMYAAQVPPLHFDPVEHQLAGGLFWDGRRRHARGSSVGSADEPARDEQP